MKSCLNNEIRRCRPLLGTFVEVAVVHDDEVQAQRAINTAFAAVERVHNLMSFHDPQSEVSRLNCLAADHKVFVSSQTCQVLKRAKEFYEHTQGVFDITVGPQLIDRGLLPRHAFFRKHKVYDGSTRDIELSTGNFVRFLRPLVIDLGGIAKGFAVDQAVEVLQKSGFESGVVNAGGDLRMWGNESRTAAIKICGEASLSIQQIECMQTAIATSSVRMQADSECNLSAACHVKMPLGKAFNEAKTVTVFADQCILADALTKIVLLGSTSIAEQCLSFYKAKALVFGSLGQLEKVINA